jgi:SAM-dependent methyltransferase/tetratricopeptide (TPR) repeat protein
MLSLAIQYQQAGENREAEVIFHRALKLDPKSAEAHHGLARLLLERDELDEAMIRLQRALVLRPDDTAARMTMVQLLRQQGKRAAAAAAYERALASDPQIVEMRRQLLDELAAPWTRPLEVARTCLPFIKFDPAIAASMRRAVNAWPKRLSGPALFGAAGVGAIARDRVLRFLLEACPISSIELERFLTEVRGVMLTMAHESHAPDTEVLGFCCSLAGQCFFNDYVFSTSEIEVREAERLRDRLAGAIAKRELFPVVWLPVVACYYPLHTLAGADGLLDTTWPEAVAALLKQQVAEPREELAHRAAMPVLTAVDDPTSLRVRQQYEESPFPRWVKPGPVGEATTLDAFVRDRFPNAGYRDLGRGRDIDILVAGCGTGQHSTETARRFAGARIVAIDLSLASLGYAKRQSLKDGLDSIQYAQADIMNLPATGLSFDLIECSGVLHHLGDPLEGWRRLLTMLRSHGIMRVGLYSELARQDIVAAKRHIAERQYGDTAEDIRRCRQELMDCPEDTPLGAVASLQSFFRTNECRDLLFHRMEHRLTLPVIKSFLAENGLEFLGFEIDGLVQQRYLSRFPADKTMIDLDNWHRFEERHPSTFVAMYQFWVHKRA